jgi:hypothetical protein
VHRDRRAAAVSVPHDVAAASGAGNLEARPLSNALTIRSPGRDGTGGIRPHQP